MGQQQSSQRQKITQNYTIVKTVSPGEYWIKRKKKGDELLLRILSFPLQQDVIEYMKHLDRRKKIKNSHLLDIVEYNRVVEQYMCSQAFKLRIIIEFPFKTLKDDILQRASTSPKRYFTEDELWSILYSCCHALYALYVNKLPHQSLNSAQIYIDTLGIIKLADGIVINCSKNYLSLMGDQDDNSNEPVLYISPELINLVEENNFYYYQKEKSDVYILGMILLEAGNLKHVDYYQRGLKKFDLGKVEPALNQFKIKYNSKLTEIIEKMLKMQAKYRPCFEQIIENIELKTVHTSSNFSSKGSVQSLGIPNFLQNAVSQYKKVVPQTVTQILPNHQPSPAYSNYNEQSNKVEKNIVKNTDPFDYYLKTNTAAAPFSFQFAPANGTSSFNSNNSFSLPNNILTVQPAMPNNTNSNHPFPSIYLQSDKLSFPSQKNKTSLNSNIINTPIQNLYSNIKFDPIKPNDSVPKYDTHPTTEPFMPKNQPFKLDSIMRDFKKITQQSYTPYEILSNFPDSTRQQKNKEWFNNALPRAFASVKINQGVPAQPPKFIKQRRFSQSKFGSIEIPLKQPQQVAKTASPKEPLIKQVISFPSLDSSSKINNRENEQQFESGIFVIEQNQMGKYEGFKNNLGRNGIGRIFYADGGYYQGQWKDNRMQGYGKLYYQDNRVAYEGYWFNNQFNGNGRVYNDLPDSTCDSIDYSDFSNIGQTWQVYEGQFVMDSRNGRGVMKFVNGQKFVGNFVKDVVDGQGCFYKKDGTIVQGIWKKNKIV